MSSSKQASIKCASEADLQARYYPQGATVLQHQVVVAGIDLAYYRHSPAELPESIWQQHLILVHTEVPAQTQVEQVTEGRLHQTAEIRNGDIIILPAQTTHRARWNQEHDYLALIIEPVAFERRLGETLVGHSVELLPQFCLPDTLLCNLSMALKTELETSGFGGQLYIDSLLTTLSAHLLRHYSHQNLLSTVVSGLPNYKLQQVLEYIHTHLQQDLALAELAAIAQVSPNYFATQFKHAIGYAPHQYVIRQRIERGKALLINSRDEIADIACQLGFAHQSHFTRHFKRLVGVTPKQFLNSQ